MSSFNVEVTGFDALVNEIKKLADDKTKRKESLMILRQIAKPTLEAAKREVPVSKRVHVARGERISPGNLKKSLGTITGKNKENPTILVGPRVKGSQKGWYGHMVHDGVNVYRKGFKRKHKKGANNNAAIRRTRSNPYLTRAYDQTQGKVTAEAEAKFVKFVQRRLNKLQ
jgi:hypothetical protein